MTAIGLTVSELRNHGLVIEPDATRIDIELRFEQPASACGRRLKGCSVGAFTYLDAAGNSSACRYNSDRYAQIGDSSILGPPERPMGWFSPHSFTFTRPGYMLNMYRFEDFARLAQDGLSYADLMPIETTVGHETNVGVGSFVKPGVRMRFAEPLIERFPKLQGSLYDLAPHKNKVDFSNVEATLAYFEERLAEGALTRLSPVTYSIRPTTTGYDPDSLSAPLY